MRMPIFKSAAPKPPPPPPPPAAAVNNRQSVRLLPQTTVGTPAAPNGRQSVRMSQRLAIKSIRLTAGAQPASFHIESEPIPEEQEEPPSARPQPQQAEDAQARPPPVNIFAAIRRGSTLKKVDLEEETKKKQEHIRSKSIGGFGDSSVAAILERRKFLEAESSGSDSDKDDDDWN